MLLLIQSFSYGQTAIKSWGQLRVQGTDIVNEHDEAVQLQGMSLFWSQWEGSYYEYNTIKWLRDDWCNNIVRAACGVQDNGSAHINMEYQLSKARAVIDAAIKLDIYVLVDWHAHYATRNIEHAKTFFRTISKEYGQYPNVIYETFNEPIGYSWGDLKPYHEEIIDVIRANDPDNIIICGTPEYSAYPDAVIGNAINRSNIAYTLHYYAASHFQDYRNRANAARANGLCVFVTEYGLVNYKGEGSVDEGSSRDWYKWMNDNKISHCNWSLCDKDEGASALKPGTSAGGFWRDDQLTWSGGLVRNHFKNSCPEYKTVIPVAMNIPAKIEAEKYTKMSGIQREDTEDEGGGQNIGYTDKGDYIEYLVRASGAGEYQLDFRVAAKTAAIFDVYLDGNKEFTINVYTGDWQTWETISKKLSLTSGEHTVKLVVVEAGWNLNYINFTANGLVDCNGDIDGGAMIDNCDVCSGGLTGLAINVCEGGCLSGIGNEGVKDDFTLVKDPALLNGKGVFSWGETTLGGDDNPLFKSIISRNSVLEVLEVVVTQGEGKYVPFGFGFGGDDQANTIDLTKDASFEFVFENKSTTSVTVALAIQDVDGNIINTLASANGEPFSDAWMYSIEGKVNAGATYTFKGTFEGGFNADYVAKAFTSKIDLSKISTVLLTVTNQKNTGLPDYFPLALKDIKIHIKEMRIGNCATAQNDNNKDCNGDMNGDAFIDVCEVCAGGKTGVVPNACITSVEHNDYDEIYVFPNPTTGILNISEEVNWSLQNHLGEEIDNGFGKLINLENRNVGVYFVRINYAKTELIIMK